MSATVLSTARPPYAVTTWCDRKALYIEFSSINGPCVISYPRTAKGFADALSFMTEKYDKEGSGEIYHSPPSTFALAKDKNGLTDTDRQNARDILKRMKII